MEILKNMTMHGAIFLLALSLSATCSTLSVHRQRRADDTDFMTLMQQQNQQITTLNGEISALKADIANLKSSSGKWCDYVFLSFSSFLYILWG